MSRGWAWAIAAFMSCTHSGDAPKTRAEVRRTGGTTFELVPASEQLPYCLAFTHSRKGITRQLTMSSANLAFECPAGKPVGGRAFKVPLDEGPVKLHVLFSSDRIDATTVAEQLLDQNTLEAVSVMDLRLPGRAALETLEFTPEADVAPAEGQVLARDAGTP
jgi:hypothetical protein